MSLTAHKYGEKEHLAQESPHTGNSAVAHRQQITVPNTQTCYLYWSNLITSCKPHPFQNHAETPITAEILQTLD